MKGVIGILTVAILLSTAAVEAATPKKSAPATFDTKPGPAFLTVEGTLHKIDGNVYVVEDYTGKELRMYVSKDTKKIRGEKKPGDLIRAEVTKGWYANSIQ
jgi:hypothetical protein